MSLTSQQIIENKDTIPDWQRQLMVARLREGRFNVAYGSTSESVTEPNLEVPIEGPIEGGGLPDGTPQ